MISELIWTKANSPFSAPVIYYAFLKSYTMCLFFIIDDIDIGVTAYLEPKSKTDHFPNFNNA